MAAARGLAVRRCHDQAAAVGRDAELAAAALNTAAVDWRHAALAPWREAGCEVLRRHAAGESVAQALNACGGAGRFVPQALLPAGEAYEAFVGRTGQVPTRDELHDLFNGLVWLGQPALKTRLNALHAQALALPQPAGRRGALRDALTLFDESGAVLEGPDALRLALAARDWRAAFVEQAETWRTARLLVVGHALLEKLAVAPRKGHTAHGWWGELRSVPAEAWAAKPFVPVPVHGIPGWWPEAQDAAFYADAEVFRPPQGPTARGSVSVLKGAGSP